MKHKHDKNKIIFDLQIIRKDRVANIIFILGATVALIGLDQREQSIKQSSNQESATSEYNFEKSIALSNWIYLIASIIFINTTSANLQRKIASRPRKASLSSEKNIGGSKMVVDGILFKVVGYLSSAIGREIIANSNIASESAADNTMMEEDRNKATFDLDVTQKDIIANLIFIFGVNVSLIGLDQREQSIKQFLDQNSTIFQYNLEKSLALANWIYLIDGIIFVTTSSASLERKIETRPMKVSLSSELSILGGKLVLVGNLFKSMGYIVTATGREIIAESTRSISSNLTFFIP